jgi:hypothetical protein
MAEFMKLRTDFSEVDAFLQGLDLSKIKVTGSYLWDPNYADIDFATYDPDIVVELYRRGRSFKTRIDMMMMNKESFDNLENLMTFRNFCMCYYCGKLILSPKFVNSRYLELNKDAPELFTGVNKLLNGIEKNVRKGFIVKQYQDKTYFTPKNPI